MLSFLTDFWPCFMREDTCAVHTMSLELSSFLLPHLLFFVLFPNGLLSLRVLQNFVVHEL